MHLDFQVVDLTVSRPGGDSERDDEDHVRGDE